MGEIMTFAFAASTPAVTRRAASPTTTAAGSKYLQTCVCPRHALPGQTQHGKAPQTVRAGLTTCTCTCRVEDLSPYITGPGLAHARQAVCQRPGRRKRGSASQCSG